jgi:acyl phosphate:glycerol-3-phosphate acyltransferase
MAPAAVGIGMGVWAAVFALSRYVSVASIVAAAAVAAAAWVFYAADGLVLPGVMTLLAVVLIARHRGNIKRLMQGTENRFTFGGTQPPSGDREADTRSGS